MMIRTAKATVGRKFGILQVRRTKATDDFKVDKNGNHDKSKVEAGCRRRLHGIGTSFMVYTETILPDDDSSSDET